MNTSNLYQVKKAIRFKLEPIGAHTIDVANVVEQGNDFNLPNFLVHLDEFIEDVNDYFFYKARNGEWYVKEDLIVKKDWMREYEKDEFQAWNKRRERGARREQLTVATFDALADKIQGCIDKISDDILFELECDASAELNERAKRTRTALLLKQLSAKSALPYLATLVENVSDKKEKDDLRLKMQRKARLVMTELKQGILAYLPEQSSGMAIAKASFNYYILNKKPIDFKGEIENLTRRLKIEDISRFPLGKDDNTLLVRKIKEDIKQRLNGKPLFMGEAPMSDATEFNSLRQILKNILAEQKMAFSEFMQTMPSFDELRNKEYLYLFHSIRKDEFDRYRELTEKIETTATRCNQSKNDNDKRKLRSDLQSLKKRRGDLINAASRQTRDLFVDYKKFADIYRRVAQQHGKILAKLKGIEIEQYESQLLNYWALMIEERGRYRLLLVPRRNVSKCKAKLDQKKNDKVGDVNLYWFESFTFRSLRKLCFGNLDNGTNTFYPGIKTELYDKYQISDERGNSQFVQGEFAFKGDEKRIVRFYQDVLGTRYAQTQLNMPANLVKREIVDREFETIDEFAIALEQLCYKRFVTADSSMIDYLRRECEAVEFEIHSADLDSEKNQEGKEVKYTHRNKPHTEIWRRFWTKENEDDNFDLRLNPEITVLYRKPKPSRVEKYGEGTDKYDPNKKNRYLYDQYTVVMTMTDHCNVPQKNLAFATDDEIKDLVDKFNKQLPMARFAFGLDNGETELSTFGVYLPEFEQSTHKDAMAELRNVEKYGFDTLRIKDLLYSEIDKNGKEKRIVLNPSYFVDEELYCRTFGKSHEEYVAMFDAQFEKHRLLTLDLTTAKVINGHIVENGDVATYFSLCLRNAQRLIYEMNDKQKEEKATAKHIKLKRSENLDAKERRKFVDYLNEKNDKYAKLQESGKDKYVEMLYAYWAGNTNVDDKFWTIAKGQRVGYFASDVVCAVSYKGEELENVVDIFDVHNVFKLRKDFYSIKSEQEILDEIADYNQKRVISNEELDLKLVNMKRAVVANVVGVVDKLYHEYCERFGGNGIIVKEGFDSKKEEQDRNKFEGNIYRVLERKLYQKFQNYGLVPPLKNLMMLRADGINNKKDAIMQVGIVGFVDPAGTSQECPICVKGRLAHTTVCPNNCGFTSEGIMHSNDGIAAYNIAKRGFNNLKNR